MKSIAATATENNPEPGATVAALLDQLPDVAFATKLRDAFDADLVRMYGMGVRHGSGNAWNAIDNAWPEMGLTRPAPDAAPSRPRLTLVPGGAL